MRNQTQRKSVLRAELEQLIADYYGSGGKVHRDNKQPLIAVKCIACLARQNVELGFFRRQGAVCIGCGSQMHPA